MATTVTAEQIDACTRVIDEAKREVFYLVQSATSYEVAYQVKYNQDHKCYSCTCPAGNPPTDANGCYTYAPRSCWHIRAASEHNRQHVALKQAEAEARRQQ